VHLSNPSIGSVFKGVGQCTITEVPITGIQFQTRVSSHTVAGETYRLESSIDEIHWVPVTEVLGAGGTMTVIHPGAGCNTHRRYRAITLD
jgi:hypothetical protein